MASVNRLLGSCVCLFQNCVFASVCRVCRFTSFSMSLGSHSVKAICVFFMHLHAILINMDTLNFKGKNLGGLLNNLLRLV